MIFIKYIVVMTLAVFLFVPTVSAQSGALPSPGITPDSPFYFLDRWGEGIGRFFAFGREAKAAKQAEHAEERLAEARVMVDEGEDELAEEAAREYGVLISGAASNLAVAAQSGENVDAALAGLVTRATSVHQTVLAEVYTKVPEQAKPAIERAMTQSVQGQEAALNALSGTQREAVEERAEQQRQQVEERLDTLRQQGVPVSDIPTGGENGTTPGRPTTGSGAGSVPTGSAPTGQGQQNAGPAAGVGAPVGGQPGRQ